MNHLRKIIQESINIAENVQQADKLYFRTGLLNDEDKKRILDITNGDPYTRLVADLYYHFLKVWNSTSWLTDKKMLEEFHTFLKNYNKNVFPVQGDLMKYNAQESERGYHILDLYSMLKNREFAVQELRKLPKMAIDNLKKVIRTPESNEYAFKIIGEKLRSLNRSLENLPGPGRWDDEETAARKELRRKTLLNKIFASTNSLEQMEKNALQFAMAFHANADEIGKEEIIENLQYIDATLVQDSGDILVVRADDQEAMSKLGCTSLWCFARPDAEGDWQTYAPLGYAYVIYNFAQDFEDATFMMTYLPDTGALYTSTNVPVEEVGIKDSDAYLRSIGVDMNKLYSDKPEYSEVNEARKFVRKLFMESLESSRIYIGKERGITAFLRNIDSEVSPYIKRISDTEVNIEPQAFIMEPSLEGDGGMLDFFGLKPKFSYGLNEEK